MEITKRILTMKRFFDNPLYRRSLGGNNPTPKQLIGLHGDENLEESFREKTVAGTDKVKFQEYYKGIPIIDEDVVLEEDQHGELTGRASGKLVEGVDEDLQDVTPEISVKEALQIAVNHEQDDIEKVQFDEETGAVLKIFMKSQGDGNELKGTLVYHISYFFATGKKLSQPSYIIDAKSGEIVSHWQDLDTVGYIKRKNAIGGNEKIGKYIFGQDYDPLLVTKLNSSHCAYQNHAVRVVDLQNKYEGNETLVVDCEKGPQDAINGGFSPANNVLFGATAAYDMFTKVYNIKPFRDQPIVAKVHFGQGLDNAFYTWGGYIAFGDGSKGFYPLVSVDVLGHELAHGLTYKHSGLIYKGQSGGLNEAYSDMVGIAIEEYVGKKRDWTIGEEIIRNVDAFRWFDRPQIDNISINHLQCFYPDLDNHYSSGLYNHMFFLLVEKYSWTMSNALHAFTKANVLYWTENSTFASAACGLQHAAEDLGLPVEDVTHAASDVGITPCKETPRVWEALWARAAIPQGRSQYIWKVPSSVRNLELQTSKGVSIYMKLNGPPSDTVYDYVAKAGNPVIRIEAPQEGNYHISIVTPDQKAAGKSARMAQDWVMKGGLEEMNLDRKVRSHIEEWSEENEKVQQSVSAAPKGSLALVGTYDMPYITLAVQGAYIMDYDKTIRKSNNTYNHNVTRYFFDVDEEMSVLQVETYPLESAENPNATYFVLINHEMNPREDIDWLGGYVGTSGRDITNKCYLFPGRYEITLIVEAPLNATDWAVTLRYINKFGIS